MGAIAKRCFTCHERMVRISHRPTRYECRNPNCGKEQARHKIREEQRRQGRKGTREGF